MNVNRLLLGIVVLGLAVWFLLSGGRVAQGSHIQTRTNGTQIQVVVPSSSGVENPTETVTPTPRPWPGPSGAGGVGIAA